MAARRFAAATAAGHQGPQVLLQPHSVRAAARPAIRMGRSQRRDLVMQYSSKRLSYSFYGCGGRAASVKIPRAYCASYGVVCSGCRLPGHGLRRAHTDCIAEGRAGDDSSPRGAWACTRPLAIPESRIPNPDFRPSAAVCRFGSFLVPRPSPLRAFVPPSRPAALIVANSTFCILHSALRTRNSCSRLTLRPQVSPGFRHPVF